MNNSHRIRLLVAFEEKSESSRLISMLEGSGINIRPTLVDSIESLDKLLSENSYDMLIIADNLEQLSMSAAVQVLRKKKVTLSTIGLCDAAKHSTCIIQALKLGIDDVIAIDHDQHLVGAVKREFQKQCIRQELRQAKLAAEVARIQSTQMLDDARTPIAYLQDGMFLFFNDAFRETLGFEDPDELLILPLSELLDDPTAIKLVSKVATGEDATKQKKVETRIKKFDNHHLDAVLLVKTTEYDGEVCNEVSIPSHRLSVALQAQAASIRLPKLNDRKQFIDLAQQALIEASNGESRQLIWLQDLDLNAAIGHLGLAAKDDFLDTVADYFNENGLTLGSWSDLGQGQYAIISQREDAAIVATDFEGFIAELNKKIWDLDDTSVRLNLRAGVSQISAQSSNIEALVAQAKEAWKQSTEIGSLVVIAPSPEEEEKPETTEDIIIKLKHALENNQFKLLYQPIINIHGNSAEFYEVLLRLIDDDGEEISPAKWRQEVEMSGLGALIDRWVIRESAKQLARRINDGIKTKLLINLSEAALADDGLPAFIGSLFKAAQLPKDALILQMSERDINKNLKPAIALTEALAGLQCRAAITHFGSSLSSFDTLNSLVIDWVKIDGSYTQELQDGGSSIDQLKKLLDQLSEDGRETIVPMVENASIINKLWQAGASYIQGYYVQAPNSEMQHNFELNS